MTAGTIDITHLGKAYKRYPHRWARLLEWCKPDCPPRHTAHWVLEDVHLHIVSGESVGIIGFNGAGKSTLLKIIAGTTQATAGSVAVNGRIAALLELGMGFHPDFTGRQNVWMAGQLLGHAPTTIAAHFASITDFAEIGDAIDQPVRTYSSGMQIRLAFSVATAIRPDILIVDEALSVGDAYFQHKSFERIRHFHREGTTLLFVSHHPGAVKTLCQRAILLDHGKVLQDGTADAVLDAYNALIAERDTIPHTDNGARSGNQAAIITAVDVCMNGNSVRAVRIGDAVQFRVHLLAQQDVPELTVGILIRDRLGNDVFGTNTWYLGTSQSILAQQQAEVVFAIASMQLCAGHYSLTVALHGGDNHVAGNYDWWNRALLFHVVPHDGHEAIGTAYLPLVSHWSIAPP